MGSSARVPEGPIAPEVRRLLQQGSSEIIQCLNSIKDGLYAELLQKEEYTQEQINTIAEQFIKNNRVGLLLHVPSTMREKFDTPILSAIYDYLHAEKNALESLSPAKTLDNNKGAKYIAVCTILTKRGELQ